MVEIALQFGALADDIATQLLDAGFDCDEEKAAQLQSDMSCISRLHIRGYITREQKHRCYNKLIKRVAQIANPRDSQ